jgi:hypothetical protein
MKKYLISLLTFTLVMLLFQGCELVDFDNDDEDTENPVTTGDTTIPIDEITGKFVMLNRISNESIPVQNTAIFFTKDHLLSLGNEGAIYETTDCGQTWTEAYSSLNYNILRAFKLGDNEYIRSYYEPVIEYVNDNEVQTVNLPIPAETRLYDYQKLNENSSFITTGHFSSGNPSYALKVSNDFSSFDTICQTNHLIMNISMENDSVGIVTVNAVLGVGIWKTINEGKEWISVGPDNLGGSYQATCRFTSLLRIDDQHLIATCAGFGNDQGAIVCSSDGGSTWDYTLIDNGLNDLTMTDYEIFFVGDDGYVSSCFIDMQNFTSEYFVNNINVFDKETDILTTTGDPHVLIPDFEKVYFIDNYHGFIVDYYGVIYRIRFPEISE